MTHPQTSLSADARGSTRRRRIAPIVVVLVVGACLAYCLSIILRLDTERSAAAALPSVPTEATLAGPPVALVESSSSAQTDSEKEEAIKVGREIGLRSAALVHAMVTGRAARHQRQQLVDEASRIPLEFASAIEQLIPKLKPEEQQFHKMFLGLLIDVASQSVESMTPEEQSEFFASAQRVADLELEAPELVPVPQIENLPQEQLRDLMHHGEFVVDTSGYYLSTLSSKTMALHLVAMDPDRSRSAEYLSGLQWRSRNTSSRGLSTLQMIAAQVVKNPH